MQNSLDLESPVRAEIDERDGLVILSLGLDLISVIKLSGAQL